MSHIWTPKLIKPRLGTPLYKGHRLAKGLVGCWLMNEGGGEEIYDLSGNGNHGTLVADTHWVSCKYGPCLDFDGTGDYVNIPYDSSLDNPDGFTLMAWAKSDILGSSYSDVGFVMDIGNLRGSGIGIFLNSSTDKIEVYAHDNTASDASVADNTLDTDWHFYAGTWDNSTLLLYVDGVKQSDESSPSSGTIDNNPLRIGSQSKSADRYWLGLIDNVKIYNRALSPSEIQQHYCDPFAMFRRPFSELGYYESVTEQNAIFFGCNF